jgi:aspartyl-tRNA(Asn)/glutamyl-tRNA(Gln) amidotransferase subunit A
MTGVIHASAIADPTALSAVELAREIAGGAVTARAAVEAHIARIETVNPSLNAVVQSRFEAARAEADEADRSLRRDRLRGPLHGVPITIKEQFAVAGMSSTLGVAPAERDERDGPLVARLRAAGAIVLGKLNCDEFAMGSSTERSAVKPTKNPWDTTRVPGGSSGGSAAAVAAGLCAGALGTDTGGSIRQPAAFCGVVGLKPTYGRVSRWGVIAFASSLDQVGPLTRTVEDAALLLEIIAGLDPKDETSIDAPVPRYRDALTGDVNDLRVGIPHEYYEGAIDADVRGALERVKASLVERGAQLVDITLPHTRHALPAYYIVAPAEASSNLARYDGIRFGTAAKDAKNLQDLYMRSRGQGFGIEVKRRIMLGTFALRSGYYDAYYKKAQQVRTLIKRDFDKAFQHVDVVLTPTTPSCAFRFGAKASPLEMYQADVFTLACNLAGLPGISVPCGLSGEGLPIGAQLLGKPLDEATILRAAQVIESSLGITKRPKALS